MILLILKLISSSPVKSDSLRLSDLTFTSRSVHEKVILRRYQEFYLLTKNKYFQFKLLSVTDNIFLILSGGNDGNSFGPSGIRHGKGFEKSPWVQVHEQKLT